MEGVPTIFHQVVKERNGKLGRLRVSLRNELGNGNGGLTGRQALFGIDIITNLEIEGEIGLVERGLACTIWLVGLGGSGDIQILRKSLGLILESEYSPEEDMVIKGA